MNGELKIENASSPISAAACRAPRIVIYLAQRTQRAQSYVVDCCTPMDGILFISHREDCHLSRAEDAEDTEACC